MSVPAAGTGNGCAIVTTTSGVPSRQPSAGNFGGAGARVKSPAGAPASDQSERTFTSSGVRTRASRNDCTFGSGCHGGIVWDPVTTLIIFDRFEASSYVRRSNGAPWPGRWHSVQFLKMMGATCSAQVGAGRDAAARPTVAFSFRKTPGPCAVRVEAMTRRPAKCRSSFMPRAYGLEPAKFHFRERIRIKDI